MQTLRFLAGPRALERIRDSGLRADDVHAVFGASGAAKWLTICGLDKAIFTRFMGAPAEPVLLFGTSIGAFKLAAAAQADPARAFVRLAEAYVAQSYTGEVSRDVVTDVTRNILQTLLGNSGVEEILTSPHYRFHCGAVRCLGLFGSEGVNAQKIAMTKAFALAAIGRRRLRGMLHRAVFSDRRAAGKIGAADDYPTESFHLTPANFENALLASGSIPLFMHGVKGLPDDSGEGIYRDGGILDYHPVPSNLCADASGIVLYPHFYSYLIPVWFDKFFAKRRVNGAQLDNVVLVAPTRAYVASLPGGKIPDRKDFYTYAGRDHERQRAWRTAIERSHELGDEFLDCVGSGRVRSLVEPI